MSNAKLILRSKDPATNDRLSGQNALSSGIPIPMKEMSAPGWAMPSAGTMTACASPSAVRTQPAMPGQRLSRVLAFIDANLRLDLCVTTLAAVAGMSAFYFCRSFKQSTGMTPHQFVLHRRMELAKQMLQHERLPLYQIAQEIGFPDQSQFTRVFRKIVGTTPSQFRKRCLQDENPQGENLTLQYSK